MKEENLNQDAVTTGNPTEANGAYTIASLNEEVVRLKEENNKLTEKVSSVESDRDFYKKLWLEKDEKLTTLSTLTKDLIKFAGLV